MTPKPPVTDEAPTAAATAWTACEVAAELRRLARIWGQELHNDIAGGALMDAARRFEGTL